MTDGAPASYVRRVTRSALLALALAACTPDAITSTVEQGVFYCYSSNRQPIQCFPWDYGGDWDWCNGQCQAYEGTGGYCPESTASEWSFCGRLENRTNRYCASNGEPRFPHYCTSGEFPLTVDVE